MKYSMATHYKFKLEKNYSCWIGIFGYEFHNRYMSLAPEGNFVQKYGYMWDGSSIPYKKLLRILSLGFYDPDKYCKIASLVHDGICQAIREGRIDAKEKPQADLLYYSMIIEGGMSKKQAKRRYKAIRKFGDRGIKPEDKPRNTIFDSKPIKIKG